MRVYTWVNMYLSSVQVGIQSLHVVADMFVSYKYNTTEYHVLCDWAENHKTVICLSGGNSFELQEVYQTVNRIASQLFLPRCMFKEDEQSLNNALTCVGIVVPEKIYGAAEYLRKNIGFIGSTPADVVTRNFQLLPAELELANFLNNYGLAK